LKRTSKRLFALLGALGLGAIVHRRRRRRPGPAPSHAEELQAKLAVAKEPVAKEPEPVAKQPEPVSTSDSVDERRADAHARARHAIEELGEKSD
jgi:MYXO-CTERM domain-containing protein